MTSESSTAPDSFRSPLTDPEFAPQLFLTGTGTGVGKTVAAAVLCRLREAEYWKPIQSGTAEEDTMSVLKLAPGTPIHFPAVTLKEPASPHHSASLEGIRLEAAEISQGKPEAYFTVIEGAGGVLVPLNERETIADLASALELPVVVVASSGLGTINHTLLTLEALRQRDIAVAGVILSGKAHGSNARAIRDFGKVQVLLRIPEFFPLDPQAIDTFCHRVREGLVMDPCLESTPTNAPEPTGNLVERSAQTVWHPYAQHATMPEPLPIDHAHGANLFTQDGQEIFDAVSSWWVTGHGHGHPTIARAIGAQATKLEQVIFSGCTHEPAVRLAERLLEHLPGRLSRIFYSDNGSTATEVAIKALVQKARNRGIERPRVAALAGAYHGDTFGAMSASDRSPFTAPFDPYLFEVDRLASPGGCHAPESPEALACASLALEAFAAWAAAHRGSIACVIVEPLVQGSEGMRMHSRRYLEGIDRICQEEGIDWIADEVFTGFGRTGSLFACDGRPALNPSAICLSKGLTGGFLPMGVTAFREEVFASFLSQDRSRAFFHGHSYTANPLGCAAALAGLDLCEQPDYLPRIGRIEAAQLRGLESLAALHPITGMRTLGGIAAFELPDAPGGYLASRGQAVALACRKLGALVRPLGDTIYLLPPYCSRASEIQRLYDILDRALVTLK
jgi:adenosylmethionine-8-amino-7-oxononanoate aminotransferase